MELSVSPNGFEVNLVVHTNLIQQQQQVKKLGGKRKNKVASNRDEKKKKNSQCDDCKENGENDRKKGRKNNSVWELG